MFYLSYLGSVPIENQYVTIADPYINDITIYQEQLSYLNGKSLNIDTLSPGKYNVYHVVAEEGTILQLVLLHESIKKEDFCISDFQYVGITVSALGNSVVICDPEFMFDSSYCYYSLEKDAYYSSSRILKELKNMPYSAQKKELLKRMVLNLQQNDREPTGRDIMKATLGEPIWNGFKSFKNDCSHWSQEVMTAALSSYKHCAFIKGGVVSVADPGELKCYCLFNDSGETTGIAVNLCKESVLS